MTLDKLAIGRGGIITAVQGSGALRRRLLAMGFTPGAEVMIRKKAPLGDPVELCLRGYELAIRLDDAARIEVQGKVCKKNKCANKDRQGHGMP